MLYLHPDDGFTTSPARASEAATVPLDLTREDLRGLADVSKRFFLVANLNLGEDKVNKLFFFGPAERGEALRNELGDELVLAKGNTFDAFEEVVSPTVQVRVVDTQNGPTLVVQSPPTALAEGRSSTDVFEHSITPLFLLYKPTASGREKRPHRGQMLLQQLEDSAEGYLDFQRDYPDVKALFNYYAYQNQEGEQEPLLLHAIGETFHANFDEVFSEYLLAGRDVAFDHRWLDWAGWNDGWSADSRGRFAELLTTFRNELINDKVENVLDTAEVELEDGRVLRPKAVKGAFNRQRSLIRLGAKILPAKVLLALLPYWVLGELFGMGAEKISKSRARGLHGTIFGDEASARGVKFRGKELSLAKPVVQLEDAMRDRLKGVLTANIDEMVEAWGLDDGPKQTAVREKLKAAGLDEKQLEELERSLKSIAELCQADDAGVRATRVRRLKRSLLLAARSYARAWVGAPVTTARDLEQELIDVVTGLYLDAELRQVSGALADAGRGDREGLKDLIPARGAAEDEAAVATKVARHGSLGAFRCLVTATKAFKPDVKRLLDALESWAWVRARSLRRGLAGSVSKESHRLADKSVREAADFLGLGSSMRFRPAELRARADVAAAPPAERVRVQASAEHRELAMEAAEARKSAPAQAARGEGTAKRAEPPAAAPAAAEQPEQEYQKLLLESLKAHAPAEDAAGPKGPAPAEGAAPAGGEAMLGEVREALQKIWGAREAADSSEESQLYRARMRKWALLELMLAGQNDLHLGGPLSTLYKLAADLAEFGHGRLEEFLKEHSLSEYLDLSSPEKLFDRYRRLELMIYDATDKLARFVSEIQGIEHLFDRAAGTLDSSAELFVFNGTAEQFLAWLRRNRDEVQRQYWDPLLVGQPKFILPALVCVLESAYNGDPAAAGRFCQALRTMPLRSNGAALPIPPILFGPTLGFAKGWYEKLVEGLKYDRSREAQLSCPVFLAGPTHELGVMGFSTAGPGGSGSFTLERSLSRPMAFYVLERLITGTVSDPALRVHQSVLPMPAEDFVYDFTRPRGGTTIAKAAEQMIVAFAVDTHDARQATRLSIEGAIWLHKVGVLHEAIRHTLHPHPSARATFWRCFAAENEFDPALRRRLREGLGGALESIRAAAGVGPLELKERSLRFTIDTNARSVTEQAAAAVTVTAPWINQLVS